MLRALPLILVFVFSLSLQAQTPSIREFTQGFEKRSGFLDIYYDQDSGKLYLQVPQSQREYIFQSSLPQGIGSNDIGLDRGQLGETRLVRFERFGNKVLLRQLNTRYRAGSDNHAEQASIDQAFADSVIAGFSIVAKQDEQLLIDYTAFLLSDIHQIAIRLDGRKQGKYKTDPKRSGVYMARTKSFPDNTEMEALVTFAGSKPGKYVRQVTPAPHSISVHLHHSYIRLPDDNYQTRAFHPYSGFYSVGYKDYSVPIDKDMQQRFIPRHRLKKRQPAARVSEAVEPIVYYLDPGIPEPVMSALKEGALWWNQAFEAIGYKDAFQVKVLPEGADPMDVRYNLIQWVHRATRGWSYGYSVQDPRTGEILKGHVTLGSLRVRQDYLIALGLTSPFGSKKASTQAQQQMALKRIKQLSAHEIGHTLGIAHNFAASANNRASVMDYPHPKLSIKNGKVALDDAYDDGIGEWDKYVVAYGYQDLPETSDETAYLTNLVNKVRAQGLAYQSDPDARGRDAANPKGHLWDNGGDPLVELKKISQIRKLALNNFGINSLKEGKSLSSLQETLVPIYLLHRYQLDAVAKLIGGRTYEYELKGDYSQPKGVSPVDASIQQTALDAILATMTAEYLRLPEEIVRLITPKAYGESLSRESFQGRTGLVFDPISAAESAAGYALTLLLQPERLNRLIPQVDSDKQQLNIGELLQGIQSALIKIDLNNSAISKRIAYVALDALVNSSQQQNLAPEARAKITYQLQNLGEWLVKRRNVDHKVMGKWLQEYLKTGKWQGRVGIKPLPPGSPI